MSSVEDFLRNRFGSEADNLLTQIEHVSSIIENKQSLHSDTSQILSSVKYIDQHVELAPDNSGYSLTINKQFDKATQSQTINNLKEEVEKLRKLYASKSQQVKKLKQKLKQALGNQKVIEKPIFQQIIKQKIVTVNVQVPVEKIVEVPKQIIVKQYVEVEKPCEKCALQRSKISQQASAQPKKGKKKNFISKQEAQKKKNPQNLSEETNQIESTQKPKVIQIEKIVQVEKIIQVQKIVEKYIPMQKIVEIEKIVQVPVEKIVEVQKIVEVEKIVEVPVQKIVEVPVYNQTIIQKQVPVQKIIQIQKLVQVPIQILVEVQKIIQVPVQKIVQIQKIIYKQVPQIQFIEKIVQVQKIVEKKIQIPVEKIVEKTVQVEKIIEKIVPVQKLVEVQKIVQKYIENSQDETLRQQVQLLKKVNQQLQSNITKVEIQNESLRQNFEIFKSKQQQFQSIQIEKEKLIDQLESKAKEGQTYKIACIQNEQKLNSANEQLKQIMTEMKIIQQQVVLGREYKRQLEQYRQKYREVIAKTQQLLTASQQQQSELKKASENINELISENNTLKIAINNLENQINSNNLILSQEKKVEQTYHVLVEKLEEYAQENKILKEKVRDLQTQILKIQMPSGNHQLQMNQQCADSNYQTPRKALITSKSTDNFGVRTSRELSAGKSQRSSRIAYHYNNEECMQANIKKQLGQCSQKSLIQMQQFQKLLRKNYKNQNSNLQEIVQKISELIISLDHKDKMVNQLKAIIQQLQQQIKQKQTIMVRNSRVTNSRKKAFDEDYYESLAKVLSNTEKALEKCQCQKLQVIKRNELLEDQIRHMKLQMKKTYDPQTEKLIEQLIAKYEAEKKAHTDLKTKLTQSQYNINEMQRTIFERDQRINYLNFILIKKQGKKTLEQLNQIYKNEEAMFYRQKLTKLKEQNEQLRERLKLLVSSQYANYEIEGADMINSERTHTQNSKNSHII